MYLRRFLFLLFAVFALGPPALAQKSGAITSAECVTIDVTQQSTVGIQVTGTWTGTLQPKISLQGQTPANLQVTPSTSSTAQATITANGVYRATVAGGSTFLVCGATVASGTATVFLNASQGVAVVVPTTATNVAFSGITPGTNTLGALHVGTGSSLDATGSGAITATGMPYSGNTTGSNLTAKTEGNSGSISPTGIGQVAGNQSWLPTLHLSAPALAVNASGGSLTNSTTYRVLITFNTALGETLPSLESTIATGNVCSPVNQCTITVTAPTIPSGYTGYSVYSCSATGGCAAGAELRQAAANACVNITTNCTIQAPGAGPAVPASNTAFIQPSSLQASLCPSAVLPTVFLQRDDLNYYPYGGTDTTAGTPLPTPDGTFTLCSRLFINDSGQAISQATQAGAGPIKNALFSLAHMSGVSTTAGSNNDDRVFAFRMNNTSTATPAYGQYLGVYGEVFNTNNAASCAPVGTEDCVAGLRVRADDVRAAGANNMYLVGIHGVATTDVAAPKLGSCSPCVVGVEGSAEQQVVANQNAGGLRYTGVLGYISGSAGNTLGTGAAFEAQIGTRFATQNIGMYIPNTFSNAADFAIRSDATAISRFRGDMNLISISEGAGGLPIKGSTTVTGAITTAQLSTPSTLSGIANIGVAGATTYTYKYCAKDANGGCSLPSSIGLTTTTGNATLDGSNFNRITLQTASTNVCSLGYSSFDIFRTASGGTPSSTGKIGTVTLTDCTQLFATIPKFDDTGIAADGSALPATNTTGEFSAAGYIHGAQNTYTVASDFTTAANTNLQTITGLAFHLDGSARSVPFHCALAYSQATGLAAVAFGVQSALAAPTNIFATGNQQITVGPPATFVTGTLATLSTTTATNIVSGTPDANATNYTALLNGTVEAAASGGGNTINIMVSTATAGDAVTVLRGSYCQIY